MSYIDAMVAAVPTRNRELYIEHAEKVAAVLREHGALGMTECWADEVPEGELTSFPKAVQCREDETVVISWVMWPSRAVRDAGMPQAMADARLKDADANALFDGKRLIHGTFDVVVGGPGAAALTA